MKAGVASVWIPVRRGFSAGAYSAAAAAFGCRGEGTRVLTLGRIGPGGTGEKTTLRTPFDLASLTKPLATASLFLELWKRGVLFPDQRVKAFFPSGRATIGEASLAQLLSHSSGLPSWKGLYKEGPSKDLGVLAGRILRIGARARPGRGVEYSCLGYILLAAIIEKVTGENYGNLAARMVLGPRGLRDGGMPLSPGKRNKAPVTEQCPTREKLIQGETHDENSWFAGGAAGNAGLFGSLKDVLRLIRAWRSDDPWVRRVLALATPGLNENRSLGWFLKGPGAGFLGRKSSARAFGHTGFTGTSVMIDPGLDCFAILLTNRVHPDRNRPGSREIFAVRRDFADAVAGWARRRR